MKNKNQLKKWLSMAVLFVFLGTSGSRFLIQAADGRIPVFESGEAFETEGIDTAFDDGSFYIPGEKSGIYAADSFSDGVFSDTKGSDIPAKAAEPEAVFGNVEEDVPGTEEDIADMEDPVQGLEEDSLEADDASSEGDFPEAEEAPLDEEVVFGEVDEGDPKAEDIFAENEDPEDMDLITDTQVQPDTEEDPAGTGLYGEEVSSFLALTEEEQLKLLEEMDETSFFRLLESLAEEGILVIGEEGFALAKTQECSEVLTDDNVEPAASQVLTDDNTEPAAPLLTEQVLLALEAKWRALSGLPMTMAVNANYFSPSSGVEISGNRITLLEDVTMNSQMQVNNGEDITIDLNGHVLEMANNGCYFMINPGCTVTIDDTTGGGIVYNKTYLVWLYNGGTFNLVNGIIDGSKVTSKPQQGGAVWLASPMNGDAVFNMYGGTIRNCHSTQFGGAVYVSPPSSGHHCFFNMYGGSILDCSSRDGGAIYVGSQGTDRSTVHLEGRSKITLLGNRCNGGRGGAIFSDGNVEISGILDIGHGKAVETGCDSVYIDKNNWSGYVPEYLDVTGRLVVVGDGYIDLDTNYPGANEIVQGHTVVKNSAGLSPEEFYTYGAYFINSTRGLTVSAGFDPERNDTTSEEGPKNWHTYNSDTGNFEKQTYVDVMGQIMYVEATSEPGKRQYQDYNYLIYTDRNQPSDPILEYFAVKIVKKDTETEDLLDGAQFSLTGTIYDVYGTETNMAVSGVSSETGAVSAGLSSGETYIYTDTAYNQKLMIRDGVYTITETKAPDGYTARENFVTIRVRHDKEGDVSIVVVEANGVVLQQVTNNNINSQYGDQGHLIEHEVVLEVRNSKTEEKPDPEIFWNLDAVKYGTSSTEGNTLGGAEFLLYEMGTEEQLICSAVSTYDTDSTKRGILEFKNADGTDVQLLPGKSYVLREQTAPAGYTRTDDFIITISEDGSNASVTQKGSSIPDSGTGSRVSLDVENHRISLAVIDEAVYVLPQSGGYGIYPLVILSILLMSGTMAVLLCLQRKQGQRLYK